MKPTDGILMSVTGPISIEAAGFILPHEHIMSTFGDERLRYPHYDVDRLLDIVLPYLEHLKQLGCQTILDCTAAYFGRQPELLLRISQASGMVLLTNTGYYAAAGDRYVPLHAFTESAEQIASRWVHEWRDSIDETGIFPGFIKTAIDDGPLSEIDRKLIHAAVLTHQQTGLTIQTHTGNNVTAVKEIFSILEKERVHPAAWVWVHAHAMLDAKPLVNAARAGAWISLDGVSQENRLHILKLLQRLRSENLLQQVLLSHDGDSFCQGAFRPYEFLMTDFLPELRLEGFTEAEIHLLTVKNPAQAFKINVRSAS